MKYCFVRQDGLKDCGIACLLMIIRTHKGDSSKEYLRVLTNTTKNGTTAYDLMIAGEKFHFTTFGLRGNLEDLNPDYFPVIGHMIKNKSYQHFVVIYHFDFEKRKVTIADPALGITTISEEEWEQVSTHQYIVFLPNTPILKINVKHPIHSFLKKFLWKNKWTILKIFIQSLSITFFTIILTFSFELLMNFVKTSYSLNLYVTLILFFLNFAILKCAIEYIRYKILNNLTHRFDNLLLKNTYHHLFLLPDSYYENRQTGELLARMTDLTNFKNILSNFLLNVGVNLILALTSLFFLFQINFLLTYLLLWYVFLEIGIFLIFQEPLQKHLSYFKEAYATYQGFLVDSIEKISSIRHLDCSKYMEKRWRKNLQKEWEERNSYQNCWNLEMFLKNSLSSIFHILELSIGIYLVLTKKISDTSFLSFLFLSDLFLSPMDAMSEFLLDYQEGKASFERIKEFYFVEEERQENFPYFPIRSLELKNISYAYRKKMWILKNFNLSLRKGEKVLIYGKSGCGKSTLIKILAGYLEQEEGDVILNGQALPKEHKSVLRKEVTYISQNENLFNMSLKDNILLGRKVKEENFQKICHLFYLDEFAKKNVLTYDMMIEENGSNLSGGERQRVILARSILRESEIYILDESLCNLDVELERKILKKLFEYLPDKMVIVVSHRFYNEDLYDTKVMLEKGEGYAENFHE